MAAGLALVTACLGAQLARAAPVATPPSHFHLAGDYLLGGLFPLHAEAATHPFRARSWVPVCAQYPTRPVGYSYLQAMRFAVEEVNNASALLPGVSLGYEMVDICYHANPVHPLLYFLSDRRRSLIEVRAGYATYRPRVVALIGPDTSSTAVTAAYLCSQFLVPQLSYSATKDSLSNPRVFPSAFRTIPSTELQVALLLRLLRSFRWNWVGVLYSEDDYGQGNLRQLRTRADWACVAFQEALPAVEEGRAALAGAARERVRAAVRRVKAGSAQVVLVLSTAGPLWPFFREAVRQNATGYVWVAAEAWAMDPTLRDLPGLAGLGTFFGVAPEEVPVPGLDDFRVRLAARPPGAPAEEEGGPGPAACNRACGDCLAKARESEAALRGSGSRIDFNVYSAVYAVAHALHRLLGCNATGCRPRPVYPWQVLREMSKVNFTLLGVPVDFDERGDPPNGFEVVQWVWDTPGEPFRRVAGYDGRGELRVEAGSIAWHTENNTVPRSICSEQCAPGQMRKHLGSLSCCFECVECKAGTFLNQSNVFSCQSCPPSMWSEAGQESCFPRSIVYLRWDAPAALLLAAGAAAGLSAAAALLAVFLRHAATPVVRSAGGPLCFLMLGCLLAGFGSLFAYLGEPTAAACVARRTLFSLCFSACLACLTVRAFQIMCAFKLSARLPGASQAWVRYRGQWLFVAAVVALKAAVVALNLSAFPPLPLRLVPSRADPRVLFLVCNPNDLASVVLNNAPDMALSFACFCLAYAGTALPKHYNEAKCIALCMAGYFASWVALVVVVAVGEGPATTACDGAAGLASLLAICAGYFGPKCYVILWRPQENTPAYFQTAIQSYTMRPG